MQSSSELVRSLLRTDGDASPERVGLHDGIWGDTLRKWVDEGYPTNDEGKPVDPVDHFGFDMAGVGGWFDCLPLKGV
ncbi:MAG: hypothetical protein ACYSU0_19170, partial [Planctomycetota bacterium]